MTGAAIAANLGLARSTVARWIGRAGLGRLAQIDPPEPVRRYQRERQGELIHLDIKKLGRFAQPGHRFAGTRVGCRTRGAGWDFVPVAVDDATRLTPAWSMSRCWTTSARHPLPLSSCAPCAGSVPGVSAPRG
ncbi:MAG: hypothetical protein B7Z31_06175 [Rhodobacterales bacterium 12-65-15]|nr:MAG: hypothetical protein B7Z31_06175 [Rhodobacterales bacterium 12-65-15]